MGVPYALLKGLLLFLAHPFPENLDFILLAPLEE
jgi:hypothetical protein